MRWLKYIWSLGRIGQLGFEACAVAAPRLPLVLARFDSNLTRVCLSLSYVLRAKATRTENDFHVLILARVRKS
jgi:hypothetical protein